MVAGFFRSDPRTTFEAALGATTLPTVEEVDPERFYPSSRSVAFTRRAWERVGGYPEWLDYCEDLLFDFALEDAGCRRAWAPDAVVHFRPRTSARALLSSSTTATRAATGRPISGASRHAIRYATYLGLPLGLLAARRWPWLLGPLALAVAGYVRRPYARLWPALPAMPWPERLTALAWVPALRLIGDVAKMAGYPVGLWWRLRRTSTEIPPGHPRGSRPIVLN